MKHIPAKDILDGDHLYYVYKDKKTIILETQDLFVALDKLKTQAPGARLIRASDKKLLAYTTAPRPEDAWMYGG